MYSIDLQTVHLHTLILHRSFHSSQIPARVNFEVSRYVGFNTYHARTFVCVAPDEITLEESLFIRTSALSISFAFLLFDFAQHPETIILDKSMTDYTTHGSRVSANISFTVCESPADIAPCTMVTSVPRAVPQSSRQSRISESRECVDELTSTIVGAAEMIEVAGDVEEHVTFVISDLNPPPMASKRTPLPRLANTGEGPELTAVLVLVPEVAVLGGVYVGKPLAPRPLTLYPVVPLRVDIMHPLGREGRLRTETHKTTHNNVIVIHTAEHTSESNRSNNLQKLSVKVPNGLGDPGCQLTIGE
ncbi:hypothetical protein C8R45DRAFT_934769 [Mycena sanguinolenta]|nr:hypothetical protein C8R45DRAFT_934769 [Mycena sanguinolenta]